jgi:hypothetical protein
VLGSSDSLVLRLLCFTPEVLISYLAEDTQSLAMSLLIFSDILGIRQIWNFYEFITVYLASCTIVNGRLFPR